MKIKNIALGGDELPEFITVEISRAEALAVAAVTGRLPHTEIRERLKADPVATAEVYNALAGSVFNRFWEDGVAGAERGDTE